MSKRELFRSFLKSYILIKLFEDKEIGRDVEEILQAFGDDKSDGNEQLVNFKIDDFHKHYLSHGNHGKGSSSSEKLNQEYQTALNQTLEAQNTIRELDSLAEKWNDEKYRRLTANAGVRKELELAETEIASGFYLEDRSKLTSRVLQLEEKEVELSDQMESVIKPEKENSESLKKQIEGKRQELSEKEKLQKKTADVSEIKTLKQELAKKNSEINRSKEEKRTLLKQIKDLEQDLNSTRKQKLELEEKLNVKYDQLSKSLTQAQTLKKELQKKTTAFESLKKDVANKKSELDVMKEEKKTLLDEIKELKEDLYSTHNQTLDWGKELKSKTQEIDNLYKEINSICNQKHKVVLEAKN